MNTQLFFQNARLIYGFLAVLSIFIYAIFGITCWATIQPDQIERTIALFMLHVGGIACLLFEWTYS